jgi:predicted small metal-binding protein
MANQLWCRDVFDWLYLRRQGEDIREVLAQFMAHAREVHRVTPPKPFGAH